ncbi:MAG: FAD-dependent oxidoreductase, partial [Candidatus Dormibacteraeota bacterium]|nr:FAD-dependent oxidoreductase [Candidatus Dormibacteraeota bacterium]
MAGRVVIIGAGPVGLGAAYRLRELGHRDWVVYERSDHVGGLASSVTDEAGFTYDIGGHVMFSHYPYFDRLVDRLLGPDHTELMRESWIWMRGRWIPYPLQNNIRHLPPDALLECLEGLVDVQRLDPTATRSFAGWVDAVFGSGIARHFMRPYNFKVWAHPLEMMSKDWIAERVSLVDLKRVLANVVNGTDELSWGPNNKFKYPLYGGTGGLYQRFLPYVGGHLQLNREVVGIDPDRRTIHLADGSQDRYDELVSAVPIPSLLRMLTPVPGDLVQAARDLHHSSGLVVGVGVAKPCPTTKCWTYFPEGDSPFYRVTFLSNYSPNIAPEGHMLLLTETSSSPHKPEDRSTIEQRVVDGLLAAHLLEPEDRDRIVTTHTIEVDHFYPIPTLGRDRALAAIQPYLAQRRIHSRGRFGAWMYEISNMDHSVMQGVELVDSLLLGEEEQTWRLPLPATPTVRLEA